MLTEPESRLITAAIDGELTPSEERALRRLLLASEEARRLFGQLQADAARLRRLPPASPAEDIAGLVVRQIIDRGLTPTPPPPRRRISARWNMPTWAPLAAAAAVMVAVTLGSYLILITQNASSEGVPSSAKKVVRPEAPVAPAPTEFVGPPVPVTEETPAERPRRPRPEAPSAVARNNPGPSAPERLPFPQLVPADAITAPSDPPVEPFAIVQIRLALILSLRELCEPAGRQKLKEELAKGTPVRLELFCDDSTKAFDRLRAAFRTQKHTLLIDRVARERLKNRLPTHYVFYADSLTPEGFAAVMEKLAKDDAGAEKKKAGEGQFGKFVMTPFQPADQKDLSQLLGVPLSRLSDGRLQSRLELDPTRPLNESTAVQVAQARKTDASPRSGGSAQAGSKPVLVLPFADRNGRPIRSIPALSKEILTFLQQHRDPPKGATPVLLVLRTVNP